MESINHNHEHRNHKHNKHGHHDHSEHHRMMMSDFRRRFWWSLAVTIPILILSPTIGDWLGFDLDFAGKPYILFALSSFVFFYGGWPFIKGLITELSDRTPGMMTLIAVAICIAYGYSSAVVFGLPGKTFFWELATLIVVMLAGHWIEMRSVLGASRAMEQLSELMPDTAHKKVGDAFEDVPVEDLGVDDVVLIKPGEKVPADGTIVKGNTDLNESMLTGESTPVDKGEGDEVIGGSVNGTGSVEVKVHGIGDDSYLSKVIRMVGDAQSKKSKTQKLADRAAFWLTIVALSAGTITLAAWLIADREFPFALERMVTVMVIACPHALGLAIPLVASISTAISARNGLLIRNRTAFESARKITTLIFDKTGTLTTGEFGVSHIEVLNNNFESDDILTYAAALESNSEHPIAQGIIHEAKARDLELPEVDDFQAITGIGVSGTAGSKSIKVVSRRYLDENNIDVPATVETSGGKTISYVIIEEKLSGFIALSDRIRPESKDAIRDLHEVGIRILMITGDNEEVAASVSTELGIDNYKAGMSPEQKLEEVKRLREEGEFVAMTGDGVNDAPALAEADIGIAVGSGTDVAAETADIILVESDPGDIVRLISFGKSTYQKMVQNLFWATAYNVVAIPLAAGALFFAGIMISPALGAALMSLSTVIVAINAQLLRRKLK